MSSKMYVIKRNGQKEAVQFDKITTRIEKLCYGLNPDFVDAAEVAQKVVTRVYAGVTTTELDNLAAETAAHLCTKHPDYSRLAARIAVSNLQSNTKKSFSETMKDLYTYVDAATGKKCQLIADDVYALIEKHKEQLDSAVIYSRDFEYDYFGFKTLERSYLLKINGVVVERPQQMLMRVSLGIHKEDIESAIETYHYMSQKWFTHASPTLFNSGTPNNQLSSCFLVAMRDDSIDGIYDTLKTCAAISKSAGGIGLHVSNIRARGSYIRGTNGNSNGLVPMLRVFNSTARYVDQGGGKRPGAFAIYLEPWHADVFEWLDLRKNTGTEEIRARDLFYALWVCDLFMQRVADNSTWSLFCPTEAPGLVDVYGEEFNELYTRYEKEGRARKTIRAQELWWAILDSQTETGTPYMLYKDACNIKSNQKNLGTIKSSNLCTEIIEYSAPDEVAVCNLGSISLPKFVSKNAEGKPQFDYQKLKEITMVLTRNLNKVIDINYYPVPEARNSNMRHRPIGLGVQGLADAFILLRLPFDSDEAREVNKLIFETIYFGAVTASVECAKKEGPYSTFEGSPASKGQLQFDLWNVKPSGMWDWTALKAELAQHGMRNSLLVAPMPTASTSQILGNNECIEPYTSNIYARRVTAGEFAVVNPHLLKDLTEMGLWTPDMKNEILAANGSIQGIEEIPDSLKAIYRTVWEIKQRTIIDMAAERAPYIDQSQSLNVFIADPNHEKLTSMHFRAWRAGLKTGMYYLRTQAAANAIKFTVDQEAINKKAAQKKASENEVAAMLCRMDNPDSCVMCSG